MGIWISPWDVYHIWANSNLIPYVDWCAIHGVDLLYLCLLILRVLSCELVEHFLNVANAASEIPLQIWMASRGAALKPSYFLLSRLVVSSKLFYVIGCCCWKTSQCHTTYAGRFVSGCRMKEKRTMDQFGWAFPLGTAFNIRCLKLRDDRLGVLLQFQRIVS
jgi:hypothetical protein